MLHLLENHHKLLNYLLLQLFTNLFSKLVITQFADQLKTRDTSQLINGISSVFQRLLKVLMAQQFQLFMCLVYLHHSLQQ